MKPSFPTIAQHRYKNIAAYSDTFATAFAEEDIHQFRLEVKKLRAVHRLLNTGNPPRKKFRLPARLRAFYDMTGTIRDLQLQRRALLEFAAATHQAAPASCIAVLDGRIEVAMHQARLALELRPFRIGGRTAVFPGISREELTRCGRAFVEHEIQLLRELQTSVQTSTPLKEETLHEWRKSLKDIGYVWAHLDASAIGSLRPEALSDKDSLQTLTALLGEFRDLGLHLQLLHDPALQSDPFIKAASKTWQDRREEILKIVRRSLVPAPINENVKRKLAHKV